MDLPSTPSFRLDGKRALVTGASSGIGLGCAVACAEAGAHVVLAARSRQALEDVASTLNELGHSVEVEVLDVADIDAVKTYVSAAEPFDVLVNSAGMARHGPAIELSEEDFDVVSDVYVRGAYFLTREVAKRLILSLIHISEPTRPY